MTSSPASTCDSDVAVTRPVIADTTRGSGRQLHSAALLRDDTADSLLVVLMSLLRCYVAVADIGRDGLGRTITGLAVASASCRYEPNNVSPVRGYQGAHREA